MDPLALCAGGGRFLPFDHGFHPLAFGLGAHWALPLAATLIFALYLFGEGLGHCTVQAG